MQTKSSKWYTPCKTLHLLLMSNSLCVTASDVVLFDRNGRRLLLGWQAIPIHALLSLYPSEAVYSRFKFRQESPQALCLAYSLAHASFLRVWILGVITEIQNGIRAQWWIYRTRFSKGIGYQQSQTPAFRSHNADKGTMPHFWYGLLWMFRTWVQFSLWRHYDLVRVWCLDVLVSSYAVASIEFACMHVYRVCARVYKTNIIW